MLRAISNTSPLLYLYRAGALDWVPDLFDEIWVPQAVIKEFNEGRQRGYDVPDLAAYPWIKPVEPKSTPSEWLALDLGPGELGAMALALENPTLIVLLDDLFARRTAEAAGLKVWGTLGVLLEAKGRGVIEHIKPVLDQLQSSGMWISDELFQRILYLAGE